MTAASMAVPAALEQEIRRAHAAIWEDWFGGHGCSLATLEIEVNDQNSPGFSPSKNLIYLPLCSGDATQYAPQGLYADDERWRVWKQALVHEMLHEYEHKVVKQPSDEGKSIRATHKVIFDPTALHGDLFYSAIAEKAAYFGLGQEQFRDTL
ncbi:MAG: hypothetical protein K8T26_01435 [Lentisphaerae bacterium]|nr:hypothetical protein [Lentisphaerota bacterium]